MDIESLMHCNLQRHPTNPRYADEAPPTPAHVEGKLIRALHTLLTSEAYLRRISVPAFTRAGPRLHNGGILACAFSPD